MIVYNKMVGVFRRLFHEERRPDSGFAVSGCGRGVANEGVWKVAEDGYKHEHVETYKYISLHA